MTLGPAFIAGLGLQWPRPTLAGVLGFSLFQEPGTVLGAVGMMDLAYVCEWEKWAKSTYCPSLPLACAWSCRNLIAFTTDLRNDDQGECLSPSPGLDRTSMPCRWAVPGVDLRFPYTCDPV